LEHNPDFKKVREWLGANLQTMRAENDSLAGTALGWNQGGCQALAALLHVIDTARETMRVMESQSKPTERHSWS
jgi:hypothetical protein